MTPDPLAGDVTNPQSLNRYAYVLNNPTTLVDPLGLAAGDNVCLHNPGSAACGNDVGGARALPPGAGLFGVDGIDLAAAGLLPLGPPSAALPGCGAEFATCVPYSGGPLGFDITGIHDFGGNDLDCAMGEGCESAGITQVTLDSGAAGAGGSGGCPAKILGAVNQTFGTSFTSANVQLEFKNGQATDLNILGSGLPAAQFNSIQTGRYPLSPLTWLIGYGPTLHITGQTFFDPVPAVFKNSNVGGATSVLFTAHIDSSFAYNPIGALIHLSTDLLHIGGPRKPCP